MHKVFTSKILEESAIMNTPGCTNWIQWRRRREGWKKVVATWFIEEFKRAVIETLNVSSCDFSYEFKISIRKVFPQK